MLVPRPPRPVGRRRAVAEMTVAAKQVVAIAPGHVLVVPAVPPPGPTPPAALDAPVDASEPPPVSPDRHDTPF